MANQAPFEAAMHREAVRTRRVREMFEAVLASPERSRAGHARELAGDDEALATEVLRLVASASHHDALVPFCAIDAEGDDAARRELLAPGATVGGVEIVRCLSAGATCDVYEARQQEPERRVAVKVFRGRVLDRDERLRFRREAQLMAILGDHPAIVPVLAHGADDDGPAAGRPFILMPFIEGRPLDAWAVETAATPADVARLVAEVADAVHHAHERNVVHRDLKPSNIVVDDAGRPHVLDLGVATMLPGPGDAPRATLSSLTGAVVGTVAYMAPEQLSPSALPVDPRADVYALGAILYELLAGAAAVETDGLTLAEVARRKETARPRAVRRVSRNVSDLISSVVGMALEADRDERYASAAALATDLRRAAEGKPLAKAPAGRWRRLGLFARREPVLSAVIGVAIAALMGGAAIASWQAVAANRARAEAVGRFEALREFAWWVITDLDDRLEELPGTTAARRAMAAHAVGVLDTLSTDDLAGDDDLLLDVAQARIELGLTLGGPLRLQLGDDAAASVQHHEAGRLLARALADDPDDPRARLLEAIRLRGLAYSEWGGDLDRFVTLVDRSVQAIETLCRERPDDPDVRIEAATSCSLLGVNAGKTDEREIDADALLIRGVEHARRAVALGGGARATLALAQAWHWTGDGAVATDPARARDAYEASMRHFDELAAEGAQRPFVEISRATTLARLGRLRARDDPAQGERDCAEAVAITRRLRDRNPGEFLALRSFMVASSELGALHLDAARAATDASLRTRHARLATDAYRDARAGAEAFVAHEGPESGDVRTIEQIDAWLAECRELGGEPR